MFRPVSTWRIVLCSPICLLLTTWPTRGGESAVATNQSVHSGKLVSGNVDALRSVSADYLTHLQGAIDTALLDGFWKFGTNVHGFNVSMGVVKLRIRVSPGGQCAVERVASNTSDPVGEYVATYAVRAAKTPAFPIALSRFIPSGLTMDLSVSYRDFRTVVALAPQDQERADPARAESVYLQKQMSFKGLATHISDVRAMPALALARS